MLIDSVDTSARSAVYMLEKSIELNIFTRI